jgi:hypothetical protein
MWLRGDVIPDDAARITPSVSEYAEHRPRDYPLKTQNITVTTRSTTMNILGLWAANKAALAAGLAINTSSAVRVSPLDGFAIGSLLCGACILVASSPRRPWRSLLSRPERTAMVAGAHRSGRREPRAGRPRAEERQVAPRAEVRWAAPQAEVWQVAARAEVRQAAARAEVWQVAPRAEVWQVAARAEVRRVAPRAVARRVVRQADTHRAAPRHAAPPAGLAGRMTGLLPSRAMAGRAMAGRAMAGRAMAGRATAGSGMGASARD